MTDYTAMQWESSALLIIDVQNDFIDGALPVAGTVDVLPALRRLAETFRTAKRPIVHVIRYYEPGGSDADNVRRADMEAGTVVVAPGTDGANTPATLTRDQTVELDSEGLLAGDVQVIWAGEAVVYKPRWSAFFRTELESWLVDRDVTSVVVAGCNLPNCPRATLFDASERDLRAALVADAVSQGTPERLDDLRLIGINVLDVADVERSLAVDG